MKAHLPPLAFALLLAAVPAFADDLLDAVLWDGPSAFPDKAEAAPEPPPAPEPAPSPAVAPAYPSRSSYAPRAPSPASLPPPAAPESDTTAAGPATAEPSSLSGEAQIRRELEEMRARTDRLEAALKQANFPEPAAPPEPARPQYDRADWPKRARLSLNGFWANTGEGGGCTGEFAIPVSDTPFDIAMRGYYFHVEPNTYPIFEIKSIKGATVWCIWYPWRNAIVSPHAGAGIGYEYATGHRIYEGNRGEHTDDKNLADNGPTLAGRAGATLTYKRFTLKGEFILTSETKTLLAEAGLRVWEHLVLNGLIERCDVNLSKACTAFGGGITILF